MDTARYKAFLVSAECGSFTKAAEILRYTPAGVFQLVAALERDLNLTLFNRSNKGVTLTKNGELFVPLIQEMMQRETRILNLASELNGLQEGDITIGSYFSIATHWLPQLIYDFEKLYPNIRIHIMEGIRQEILSWLENNTADIGFTTYIEPMEYDWITLYHDPMLAILPRDHPFAGMPSFPIQRFQKEPLIMPANAQDQDILKMFRDNGIQPNIRYSTIDNFSAISMVECGLGICTMNELITKRFQANVVKIPISPPQHIVMGIAVPNLGFAPPAVKVFVRYAEEKLKKLEE